MEYKEILTDIVNIKVGDTVLHNGILKTVSNASVKFNTFMGVTLFGDSYNLGRKLVIKIIDLKY